MKKKFNQIFKFLYEFKYETNENAEYCINDIKKTYSDKIVNHGNLMGEVSFFTFTFIFLMILSCKLF